MLVPDIEVGLFRLSTVGLTQRQSKFSQSYPILLYNRDDLKYTLLLLQQVLVEPSNARELYAFDMVKYF